MSLEVGEEDKHVYVSNSTVCDAEGLYSAREVRAGEVLFRERPLVAMQTLANRQDIAVCAHCLRPLGSVLRQLTLLGRLVPLQLFGVDTEVHTDAQMLRDVHLSAVVPCAHSCGELYCSEECRKQRWTRTHRFLCVGPISAAEAEEHPLVRFKLHAVNTNEIFLLLADVLASIRSAFESLRLALQGIEEASVAARAPYEQFVRREWWEVALPSDDVPAAPLRAALRSLVQEASDLLRSAMCVEGLESVFTQEYCGAVIGMFEQNNIGIRLQSPVVVYVRNLIEGVDESASCKLKDIEAACEDVLPLVEAAVTTLQRTERGEWDERDDAQDSEEEPKEDEADEIESREEENGEAVAEEAKEEHTATAKLKRIVEEHIALEDDPIDCHCQTLFPPLDGTGLYTLACKMNHSCAPNCCVRYSVDPVLGLVAEVVALEDLPARQELTQAYVDVSESYEERQWALRDYGFVCECSKCVLEKPVAT